MVASTRIERCVAIKFVVNKKEPLEAVVPIDDSVNELSAEEIGRAVKNIKSSMARIRENNPEFYAQIKDGSVLYSQLNRSENVRLSGAQAERLLIDKSFH